MCRINVVIPLIHLDELGALNHLVKSPGIGTQDGTNSY
jgi:hypothetical protein